jgi:hypothetical protein
MRHTGIELRGRDSLSAATVPARTAVDRIPAENFMLKIFVRDG